MTVLLGRGGEMVDAAGLKLAGLTVPVRIRPTAPGGAMREICGTCLYYKWYGCSYVSPTGTCEDWTERTKI